MWELHGPGNQTKINVSILVIFSVFQQVRAHYPQVPFNPTFAMCTMNGSPRRCCSSMFQHQRHTPSDIWTAAKILRRTFRSETVNILHQHCPRFMLVEDSAFSTSSSSLCTLMKGGRRRLSLETFPLIYFILAAFISRSISFVSAFSVVYVSATIPKSSAKPSTRKAFVKIVPLVSMPALRITPF